ncbi:hypothetical protein ACWDG1_09140 [Streptomyces sp. NPDC001177]
MPSIAPLIAAFQRRLANLPGPVAATGETGSGEPVQVEMFAGGTWVDITATSSVLVRDDSGQISITRGIRDEGNVTEQATAAMELKNQDGSFSPRNPSGIYYGQIGRNTPFRISVPDGMGGKSYRAWVEASKWAPSWDISGNDVWTDLSANGILQRLAQGPPATRSVIYDAVTDPLSSSVVAYWPMEDASGATSLASALTSGSAMTWTGTPSLASYEGFTASDPLPDITSATLSGGVSKYSDPSATQVRFLVHIPQAGLTDGKVVCAIDQVDYSAGSAQFFELYYGTSTASNSLVLRTCASDGTVLGAELPSTVDVRGRLLYVSVELQESGTSITRQVQLKDVVGGTVYTVSDTETLTQLTRVSRVQFGPASRAVSGPAGTANLPGVAVGHCSVENAVTAIDALGVRINPIGEAAGRRIQRLCGEHGIPFSWVGDLDDTTDMGAQGKASPLSLMQECALADGGMLYEDTAVLGLGYRTRASLYDQDAALVLSYPGNNLSAVPTPVEDDRYIANKVTVTCNSVSQTYEQTDGTLSTELPPAGVGSYGSDVTLNLADSKDATLLDQAAWRVHLGTTDEARFPQISVNLAHASITPDMRRAILGLRMGDRVQITGPPSWLPPDTIDQLVLGFDEQITRFEHRITLNCQPASPYSTVGYLDSTAARLDTDDSVLLSDVSSGATSIDVAPVDDLTMLWTTDSAEVPWDIRVGGEVMRVTAVSPKIKDTFTRVTASGWGTADTGQAWTTSGGSAADYSTSGTQGLVSSGSVNVSRYTLATSPSPDVDLRAEVATSALATGGPQYAHLVARAADANNNYCARVAFNTDQSLTLVLQKRVGGTQTDLTSLVVPGTHAASTFFVLRFQVAGATLRAKCWALTETEPGPWQVSVTDSSHSAAGSVGTRSTLDGTNTNVLPVTYTYDNFQLTNVQTLTVTRSINGVVKAQTAGSDVRLATPTYLAL